MNTTYYLGIRRERKASKAALLNLYGDSQLVSTILKLKDAKWRGELGVHFKDGSYTILTSDDGELSLWDLIQPLAFKTEEQANAAAQEVAEETGMRARVFELDTVVAQ